MRKTALMRFMLSVAFFVWTILGWSSSAKAQVFIAYREAGIVNKYDAETGALIRERLIHGLTEPRAICLDHGVLYVLQQSGVVGKYDAESGAAINDHFISGFNMPQAMAVSDGVLYVASFSWPFQHLGQADNLVGKFDANTGATINASFLKTDQLAASLAVSGHNIFVSGGGFNPSGSAVFDTNTGAPIQRNYHMLVNTAAGIAANDDWVWFTAGPGTYGCIYKYSANSSATAIQAGITGYYHPLVMRVSATAIAVSGEELFVGCGSGTAVSKYNATTGDVIKTDFIADRGDRFAGIAVVPRAASGQYAVADTAYAIKSLWLDSLFWITTNGSALDWAAGLLVLLVIAGVVLAYRYRSPQLEPELAPEAPLETGGEILPAETTQVPAEAAQEAAINFEPAAETPAETAPTPPASVEPSISGMLLLGLFGFTLLFAGGLVWFASSYTVDLTQPGPDYTRGLVGMWGIDPNDAANAGGPPINRQVLIYPDHLKFQGDRGEVQLDGQWRDNGFWYKKPDGSGEVEVCHLKDPLNLELHLDTFNSGERGDNVLYKEQGSDAELKEIKDRYPGPITYPPPADIFKFWMSEYELNHLPWRADRIETWGSDPAYSRAKIYDYHSDNPQIPQLQVTVKNHRVVKVSSGESDPYAHFHP